MRSVRHTSRPTRCLVESWASVSIICKPPQSAPAHLRPRSAASRGLGVCRDPLPGDAPSWGFVGRWMNTIVRRHLRSVSARDFPCRGCPMGRRTQLHTIDKPGLASTRLWNMLLPSFPKDQTIEIRPSPGMLGAQRGDQGCGLLVHSAGICILTQPRAPLRISWRRSC